MARNFGGAMKQKKSISKTFLLLILITIVFSIYTQVGAQEELVKYLEERLELQKVPVVEIIALRKFPVSLQVVIQSTSDGERASPEDPININLVNHEVAMATRHGYFVERYIIVLLNNRAEPMAQVEHTINIDGLFVDNSPSNLTDEATANLVLGRMNLHGMSLTGLDVLSSNGIQTANILLSAPSIDAANQALPEFMPAVRLLLEDVNARGAQITICRIELRDANEDILLNYILDLQLRAENWWMADNLTKDWFPHP